MVGGQYDASPTSRVDQLIGLSGIECQQFLTQDVLARSDGSQRVPVVRGVDARNVDGTDARVGERSIEVVVAVGPNTAKALARLWSPLTTLTTPASAAPVSPVPPMCGRYRWPRSDTSLRTGVSS
jgi:hypothetical protein